MTLAVRWAQKTTSAHASTLLEKQTKDFDQAGCGKVSYRDDYTCIPLATTMFRSVRQFAGLLKTFT